MKNSILIFLFFPYFLFGQEYGFEINPHIGTINQIYLLDDNIVYKITETIDEIYIFKSNYLARDFLQNSNTENSPKKRILVGQTIVIVDEITTIDYFKENSSLGRIGQIKSINKLTFSYVPDYSFNRNAGIVGQLSKIGNIEITYWLNKSNTIKGRYLGKIKKIGNKEFEYEKWTTIGEKLGVIGKISSIGDIKINYYLTHLDKSRKGKIKSIGNIKWSYPNKSSNNKKYSNTRKFKNNKGDDIRLLLTYKNPY